MANTKISEMEEATSISENDILPIVKDGSNKKASIKTVFKTVQGFLVPDSIPIGMVVEFPSDNIPDNWLLCNGQAVSRTDYAELFAAIGTTWGAGDGSTTFNVPTKEGLVTVGKTLADSDFNFLGKIGGEKTHTLTEAELTEHYHMLETATSSSSSGTGNFQLLKEEGWAKSPTHTINGTKTTSVGGNQPHNNLQPYVASNFIIKAKQSSGVVATVVDNLNSTSATDALSAKQGKILNDKMSEIIESSSNSNGEYVKFSDGTMICTKKVTGTAEITEQYYGNFYHTAEGKYFDLGNYAQEFIAVPVLNVTFYGANPQWIGAMSDIGTLHIAKLHLIAPNSKSAGAYYNVIAIGRWK